MRRRIVLQGMTANGMEKSNLKERVPVEEKRQKFINACETLDTLKVIPEKILQAQRLMDMLNAEEIEAEMLYKCGCPYQWVESSTKLCQQGKDGKKTKPRYCDQCTTCWVENLTIEIDVSSGQKTYDIRESIEKLNEYEKTKLSPEEIYTILEILGWNKIYDYELFVETLSEMKSCYDKFG